MASAVLGPSSSSFCALSLSSSSATIRRRSFWSFTNTAVSVAPKNSCFDSSSSSSSSSKCLRQLGLCQFTQWNGLKNLGIPTLQRLVKLERRARCKGKGAYASLFGVGAPEVLVIGVVALLVFGPKGLAEVARNLGKTLRAFQPTIRELQEVSREFKSTLEKEIGIDDIRDTTRNTFSSNTTRTTTSPPLDAPSKESQPEIDPNGSPSPGEAYSSEELLKITEEQLKTAAVKRQERNAASVGNQSETESPVAKQIDTVSSGQTQTDVEAQTRDAPQDATSTMPSPGKAETDPRD